MNLICIENVQSNQGGLCVELMRGSVATRVNVSTFVTFKQYEVHNVAKYSECRKVSCLGRLLLRLWEFEWTGTIKAHKRDEKPTYWLGREL